MHNNSTFWNLMEFEADSGIMRRSITQHEDIQESSQFLSWNCFKVSLCQAEQKKNCLGIENGNITLLDK